MAPLHHHYELKGWPEPRVIVRFWIITFMLVFTWVSIVEIKIIQVQDKKPLIIGLGLTGKSLVNFLSKSHDELFVLSESVKPHEIEDIERLGCESASKSNYRRSFNKQSFGYLSRLVYLMIMR